MNQITFELKNYESEQMMMLEVGSVMSALVRNDYECLFRYEDCGIYILEFLDGDKSLGADRFIVVSADEEEMIINSRFDKDYLEEAEKEDILPEQLDVVRKES